MDVNVPEPPFAGMWAVPDLVGEVIVRADEPTGSEVGRATVVIHGATFSAAVPSLPIDRDLWVNIEWRSAGRVIATTEGKVVRLAAGDNGTVSFDAEAYRYPDSDGDGASDLIEVVHAAAVPDLGANAPDDPDVVPTGYFNTFAASFGVGASLTATFNPFDGDLVLPTCRLRSTGACVDHAVVVIDPQSRWRWTTPVDCPDDAVLSGVVFWQGIQRLVSVLCSGAAMGGNGLQDEVIVLREVGGSLEPWQVVPTPSGAIQLFAGGTGGTVYALGDTVLYEIAPGDTVSPLRDAYAMPSTLGTTSLIAGVELDGRLILTDRAHNGLVVVSGAAGERVAEAVLSDAFADPIAIAVHPTKARAYVASWGNGRLSTVDITQSDPSAWQVIAELAGVAADKVVVEPRYGAWLYTAMAGRLSRIDVLTGEVGWTADSGCRACQILPTMSADGLLATVSTGFTTYLLGYRAAPLVDTEPNEAREQAAGPLRAPVSAYGWADGEDTSAFGVQWDASGSWIADDLEDLWQLDTTGLAGRVALALIPGDMSQHMALVLIDETVIGTAFYYPIAVTFGPPGSGVLLASDPLVELPLPLFAGVGIFDGQSLVTDYELVVMALPAELAPATDSTDPDGTWATANILASLPAEAHGVIDSGETGVANGSDEFVDCYRVQLAGRRLAARLDWPDPSVDLNLLPFTNDDSPQPPYSYPVAPGIPEHVILDPQGDLLEVMLCVGVSSGAGVTHEPYTLLVVDLGI